MTVVLRSVNEKYPVIVIEREALYPDECEIRRLREITEAEYSLKSLSPCGQWHDVNDANKLDDITRVTFDGQYENTLAAVADPVGHTPEPE